jgi:hypothetical protein
VSGTIGLGDSGTIPSLRPSNHWLRGQDSNLRSPGYEPGGLTNYHHPAICCPARIRTSILWTKTRCAAVTPQDNLQSPIRQRTDSLCIVYYTIFQRSGTGGEIRTPIDGFGDRNATIAPHPCICWNNRTRTCDLLRIRQSL